MQDDLQAENERLRKHILSLLDEHVELRKEITLLRKGGRHSSINSFDSGNSSESPAQDIASEMEKLKESYQKEVERSRLVLSKYSKELNEEERLVRALGNLQNSYDKLAFKYECLATSPLGKMMIQVWDMNNKIRKKPATKQR